MSLRTELERFCELPTLEKFKDLDDEIQIDLFRAANVSISNANMKVELAAEILEFANEDITCSRFTDRCIYEGKEELTEAGRFFLNDCDLHCYVPKETKIGDKSYIELLKSRGFSGKRILPGVIYSYSKVPTNQRIFVTDLTIDNKDELKDMKGFGNLVKIVMDTGNLDISYQKMIPPVKAIIYTNQHTIDYLP